MPMVLLALLLTGCFSQYATNSGTPIDPIVAGAEEVKSPAVGQFNVKNSEVQLTDISVTADGSLTVVGCGWAPIKKKRPAASLMRR